MSQSWEKGVTDGWTDGVPDFIVPFGSSWGPKIYFSITV